jgi:uncharacterized protein
LKLLVLLIVLGVAGWWLFGRRRHPAAPRGPARRRPGATGPETMLACAHCGVHLPQAEAFVDATGRHYCSEAHRLAGPR